MFTDKKQAKKKFVETFFVDEGDDDNYQWDKLRKLYVGKQENVSVDNVFLEQLDGDYVNAGASALTPYAVNHVLFQALFIDSAK